MLRSLRLGAMASLCLTNTLQDSSAKESAVEQLAPEGRHVALATPEHC